MIKYKSKLIKINTEFFAEVFIKKRTKRSLLLALSCLLVAVLFCFSGCGQVEDEKSTEGLEYSILSDGTYAVACGTAKDLDKIVIPEKYEDKYVTVISQNGFSGCGNLTDITIPDSITAIGPNAFKGCGKLSEVKMGSGVTSIGNGAFSNCESLKAITIPGSVTSIGANAFSGCTDLEGVTVPGSVISVGARAFYDCGDLKTVTIDDGVKNIGEEAFRNCGSLTDVNICGSVTAMGANAFNGCVGLKKVNITDIADWCNISFADSYANPLYNAENLYLDNEPVTELVIPAGVTAIKDYAFRGWENLTSLTVGSDVTTIGQEAFYECIGLKDAVIGNSVTTVGPSAFAGCGSLASVSMSDKLTAIGASAFSGCYNLLSITVPAKVASIGDYAFYGCYRLVEVINKSSNITVTKGSYTSNGYIGYYALSVSNRENSYASKLSVDNGYIVLTDGTEKILVGYNGSETVLVLPSYITQINQYALYKCLVTDVTVGSGVTRIYSHAFLSCTDLTSVSFENNSGWYVTTSRTNWENKTGGSSVAVESATTAAINLIYTYEDYYWYK